MTTTKSNMPTLRFKNEQGNDYPDWERKPIRKIGEIIGGGTPATNQKRFWNGNINWFTPSEIKSKYSNSSIRKISEQGLAQSSAKLLPVGTILFTSRATIGEVSIAREECTTNQGFQSFVINSSSYSNEYTYYWIVKNKILFLRIANGSTYLEVTNSEIKKILFDAPNLKEQQKIASFLSSVDTKIEQLGKKKALLEQYKKGIMQKLFSQEIRFKDEQGKEYPDWKRNSLATLFEISAGGDIKKIHSQKHKDDVFCYPVYANSEKNKGLHSYSDIFRVDLNCVTVSGRGTLGVAHARFGKFYPIVRLLVLVPKRVSDLIFFEHAINLLCIFNESTGVPQLTAPQLKKYKVNYPTLWEQQKIASFLSAIDKKIELIAQQLEQARTFKKGLLQQMFI